MPFPTGVAMRLRSFINHLQGVRHDHRQEGSTKEVEPARACKRTRQREWQTKAETCTVVHPIKPSLIAFPKGSRKKTTKDTTQPDLHPSRVRQVSGEYYLCTSHEWVNGVRAEILHYDLYYNLYSYPTILTIIFVMPLSFQFPPLYHVFDLRLPLTLDASLIPPAFHALSLILPSL